MSWLLRDNWLGSLLAFALGATITWRLLDRRHPTPTPTPPTTRTRHTPAAPPHNHPPTPAEPPAATGGASPTPADAPSAAPDRGAPSATPTEPPSPAPGAVAPPATSAQQSALTDSTSAPAEASPPLTHAPAQSEPSAPAGAASAAAAERSSAAGAGVAPPATARFTGTAGAKDGPGGSAGGEFSQLMDGAPTLFDHLQPEAESTDVPAGKYGEGSADAVPHQGPPDGYTIKGNAQSMLFHTPDSPYYGRTKPEVWFRTEADAERAGFTKYVRRPRKSTDPRD